MISHEGFRFDLRVVPPECYGNLLQHFTGSKEHNVAMREEAQRRGLSISEYGVTEVESGEVHTFATEEELYEWLGYQFIPPELRENAGRARGGARAASCRRSSRSSDLRGDLHSHTTWSADGKSTMEEMALRREGARLLLPRGHRPLALPARRAGWRRRRKELDALNAKLKPFRLLHGVEVNIRANGTLDVADETLAGLDWVVASIHAAFSTEPDRARCSPRWRTRTST